MLWIRQMKRYERPSQAALLTPTFSLLSNKHTAQGYHLKATEHHMKSLPTMYKYQGALTWAPQNDNRNWINYGANKQSHVLVESIPWLKLRPLTQYHTVFPSSVCGHIVSRVPFLEHGKLLSQTFDYPAPPLLCCLPSMSYCLHAEMKD